MQLEENQAVEEIQPALDPEAPEAPELLRCSFCGQSQDDVNTLFAGSDNAAICNECVESCRDIIGMQRMALAHKGQEAVL